MSSRTTAPGTGPTRGAVVPPPESVPVLERPLGRLVGGRTAAQLARYGLDTGADLMRHLPRRYDTWGELTDLRTLVDGEQVTLQAEVTRCSSRRTRSGRPPAVLEATVTDGVGEMDVVLFGTVRLMSTYATRLAPGTTVLLSGKVGRHHGRRQLASPRFQVLDDLDQAGREALLARPVPIYPATDALPSWRVATAVRTVLDQLGPDDVPEPLPPDLRAREQLVDALTAYQWVHAPAVEGGPTAPAPRGGPRPADRPGRRPRRARRHHQRRGLARPRAHRLPARRPGRRPALRPDRRPAAGGGGDRPGPGLHRPHAAPPAG